MALDYCREGHNVRRWNFQKECSCFADTVFPNERLQDTRVTICAVEPLRIVADYVPQKCQS